MPSFNPKRKRETGDILESVKKWLACIKKQIGLPSPHNTLHMGLSEISADAPVQYLVF